MLDPKILAKYREQIEQCEQQHPRRDGGEDPFAGWSDAKFIAYNAEQARKRGFCEADATEIVFSGMMYRKDAKAAIKLLKALGYDLVVARLTEMLPGMKPDRPKDWWRKAIHRRQTARHKARQAALKKAELSFTK